MGETNCTDALKLIDSQVENCLYHISEESDPTNWWYSPFGASGISGSYELSDRTQNISYERASPVWTTLMGRAQGTPGTIQCSSNASAAWDDAATNPGMCIKVNPADITKLADPSSAGQIAGEWPAGTAVHVDQSTCESDGGKWITSPTVFAPALLETGHTNYAIKGCALDCSRPPTLDAKLMEEVSGSRSFNAFTQRIKCVEGKHPPATGPDGSPVTSLSNYLSAEGVPAQQCTTEGDSYNLGSGCTESCQMPGESSNYEGYDLAAWGTSIMSDSNGKVQFGTEHWDPTTIGDLVQCNSGYTKGTHDNSFISVCAAAGGDVVIDYDLHSPTATGCIADCIPDPHSKAYKYAAGAGPGTADAAGLPTMDNDPIDTPKSVHWNVPPAPDSLSCPTRYESGPGAMSSTGGGGPLYSNPTYEGCGKLPGHTSGAASGIYKQTRKNYGVTGCYPVCNPTSEICLNYTTERPIDTITDQNAGDTSGAAEDTWRDTMGSALAGASDRLSRDNISYVRRQVLNNDTDTTGHEGKEIFEWQMKCPTTTCTQTGEDGKIDLNELLGDDGIPTAPSTVPPIWILGADNDDCTTTCATQKGASDIYNLICADGDWGINDANSMTTAIASAGANAGALCDSFPSATSAAAPTVMGIGGSAGTQCHYSNIRQETTCSGGGSGQRLCKCIDDDAVAAAAAAAPDPVVPAGTGWAVGMADADCTTTCATQDGTIGGTKRICADGDWGATDEASMTAAIESQGLVVASLCPGNMFHMNGAMVPGVTSTGYCYWASAGGTSTCDNTSGVATGGVRRLCKCIDPP